MNRVIGKLVFRNPQPLSIRERMFNIVHSYPLLFQSSNHLLVFGAILLMRSGSAAEAFPKANSPQVER
jgi:hypothetical protein